MQNKVKQVTSGLMWTYAERLTAQLITILVTVVLAREIAPAEYGTISIVTVFINIANAFVINGFGNSLIQKNNSDDIDFSTVFYFSIGFSLIIYIVLFLSAPFIADFYKMPQLLCVIRVMAIRLPIAAVNSVQQAYISKRMEFKKFFYATLGGTLFSAVVGIAMVYNGFGIWSVVAQYLTNVCVDTIVLSFVSGWKPKLLYSAKRMRSLFSYGWKIMAVGVATTLYSNLRNLIIGKKFTSADLAFSEKGEQFPSAIAGNINSSISKVLFPVLSDVQNDTVQLKRIVRRSIKIGAYILFPLMFGFTAIADTFVITFLTEKWVGCIPFLKIMCMVYALQPLQTSALQNIKAIGKSGLYLQIDILKKIVGLLILFASLVFFKDVYYVVLGALIVEIISVLILLPFNKKLLSYNYREQVSDLLPIVALTGAMYLCLYLADYLLPLSGIASLLVNIIIGAVVYIALSIVSKNENFFYIINLVKGRLAK